MFVVLFTVCVCVSLYEPSDSAIELNDVVVVVLVGLVVVGEVWFVCLSVPQRTQLYDVVVVVVVLTSFMRRTPLTTF